MLAAHGPGSANVYHDKGKAVLVSGTRENNPVILMRFNSHEKADKVAKLLNHASRKMKNEKKQLDPMLQKAIDDASAIVKRNDAKYETELSRWLKTRKAEFV